jgi:uncharacterized protein (DUF302 family)
MPESVNKLNRRYLSIMSYHIEKTVGMSFDDAVAKTIDELKKEGFGILTDIDVRETLKKKLDVEFPKYRILGACNPPFALRSLKAEERVGLLLPCNVIVRETASGKVEVAAIDPLSAMSMVENDTLKAIADEVRDKLKKVIAVI